MSYKNKLKEMNIAETRIDDIFVAMDKLHAALSKLDNQNLSYFTQVYGLLGHLDVFCREEGVRNIPKEMYNIMLMRSARKIDFNEFPEFAEKLFYMVEEAAEVGLPGAYMMVRALKDMRKFYPKVKLYTALARQALAVSMVTGQTPYDLEYHISGKYNDTHRHMNENGSLGTVYMLRCIERGNDEHGESGSDLCFVKVELNEDDECAVTEEQIKKAIIRTFSNSGCSHEHDCCGCVSTSVRRVKRLTNSPFNDSVWCFTRSWYRNV